MEGVAALFSLIIGIAIVGGGFMLCLRVYQAATKIVNEGKPKSSSAGFDDDMKESIYGQADSTKTPPPWAQ